MAATGLAQSYADEYAYDLAQTYNLAQPNADLPLELESEEDLDKEISSIKKQISECQAKTQEKIKKDKEAQANDEKKVKEEKKSEEKKADAAKKDEEKKADTAKKDAANA